MSYRLVQENEEVACDACGTICKPNELIVDVGDALYCDDECAAIGEEGE